MRVFLPLAAAVAVVCTSAAQAEVVSVGDGAMTLRYVAAVAASPRKAERGFLQVRRWWSSAHTYSGSASNLRLTPKPGGCWCERLAGGGFVEHMRPVYYAPGQEIRLSGGLGPLQSMATNGMMTVTFKPDGAGARVELGYVVVGAPGVDFGKLAPAVDAVLTEQFGRYRASLDEPS